MTDAELDAIGAVDQLPSGRWRARLPCTLAHGQRATKVLDTEQDARAWLRGMARLLLEQRQAAPRDTLAGWGQVVLQRRQDAGLASAKDDAGRWAHVLDGDLAPMLVRAIQPQHVAAFARWLAQRPATRPAAGGRRLPTGRPISRQTQTHVLNLLRVVLEAARLDGLLGAAAATPGLTAANPARDVRPAPADEGEDLDRWTWLRAQEIAQLLTCEEIPQPIRDIYEVAIYTGLREGELWPLRWERVRLDGDRPQATVAKSNKRRSTKGKKVRAVPLLPQALAALRRCWERAGRPTEGLVFPSPEDPRQQRSQGDDAGWADKKRGEDKQGKPVVQRGWRSVAGLRADIRFHDFRHTAASHLLQGAWGRRWRLEEVRDYLGHSSITVTQRYAHLCAEALHEAAAATRTPAALIPASAPQALQTGLISTVSGGDAGIGLGSPARSAGSRAGSRPAAAGRVALVPSPTEDRAARPAGIEPAAHGLEGRTTPEQSRADSPPCDPGVTQARDLARAVLTLAQLGQPVPAVLLQGLVDQVLADPLVQLALQVREGAPLTRAIELAEQVVRMGHDRPVRPALMRRMLHRLTCRSHRATPSPRSAG